MSKENKHALSKVEGLIPELRFPEFKDEGEWIETFLGDIGDFIGGGTPDTTKPEYWNGDILWYTPTEVKEGKISKSNRTITEEGLKNSSAKLLPKGSLLLTTRATIGDIAIADSECTTNQGFQSLVVNETEVNLFWYYWIIQHKNELIKKASGSTFPEIGKNEITKIKAFKPIKLEQQKIASCLSSLDEVIAAHSLKLELLKDHKKGLMQNLFPHPSASSGSGTVAEPAEAKVPKYRFKEFEKDEEWVEKKLGEVGDIVTGSTPNTSELSNYGGEKLFVSPVDININRYVENTKTKLSELGFSKTRQIPANSVLFVCIGSTIGKVAQNKFVCATNQQINSVIPSNQCSSDFLYSALEKSASIISELAGIQAVPIINKSQFSEVILLFPPTIQEQQKIASCLSSLDALITAQAEKIEQLKLHKKGLMQGLFPKMSETGFAGLKDVQDANEQ